MNPKKILVGITGSIAAYKACDVVSALKKEGHSVQCVMTEKASRFITSLTLESLSQNKVYTKVFDKEDSYSILHIDLAQSADLMIIIPATANIMAKIATGLADEIVSSLALSLKCPLLLAPAMNTQMWLNPATQANLDTLKSRDVTIIEPVEGELACRTIGVGHIADLETILKSIHEKLTS